MRRLREIAEAATPGPWRVEYDSCDCGGGYPCSHGDFPYAIDGPPSVDEVAAKFGHAPSEICEFRDEDVEHIATFDPPTVLALLDLAEAAEFARHNMGRCDPCYEEGTCTAYCPCDWGCHNGEEAASGALTYALDRLREVAK